MNWSFRTKLILALLLFSLVPTLIMTFVMFGATGQLKDRAARVIYRNALGVSRALTDSTLNPKPLVPPITTCVASVSTGNAPVGRTMSVGRLAGVD